MKGNNMDIKLRDYYIGQMLCGYLSQGYGIIPDKETINHMLDVVEIIIDESNKRDEIENPLPPDDCSH
jgi:hypothetical protein